MQMEAREMECPCCGRGWDVPATSCSDPAAGELECLCCGQDIPSAGCCVDVSDPEAGCPYCGQGWKVPVA